MGTLKTSELLQALWCQTWQLSLLILGVAAAAALARRRPHLVYLLWMLVVVKAITPPLWSSPVGLFSWAQADRVEIAAPMRQLDPMLPAREFELDRFAPQAASAIPVSAPVLHTDNSANSTGGQISYSPTVWVLGIWLFGAVCFALVMLLKSVQLMRMIAGGERNPDPQLQDQVDDIAGRLGLTRRVRIVVLSKPFGPAVLSLFRPVVLLPATILQEKSPAQIEPLIAHELMHVRRSDSWASLLQMLAQSVWWFHPLVWWANRQACCARERCCDEETVAALNLNPVTYARSLLDILEAKHRLRPLAALPGLRSAEVTTIRLENIMQCSHKLCSRTPRWCWCVAILAAILCLPGRGLVLGDDSSNVASTESRNNADKALKPQATKAKALRKRKTSPKLTPEESELLGTWENSGFLYFSRITFHEDRTFETKSNSKTIGEVEVGKGVWQIVQHDLMLSFEEKPEALLELKWPKKSLIEMPQEKQMKLIWIDPKTKASATVQFRKIEDPDDKDQQHRRLTAQEAKLVGTWEKSTFAAFFRLTFRDDRTFESATNFGDLGRAEVLKGKWQIKDDDLLLTFDNTDNTPRMFGPPDKSLLDFSDPQQLKLIWIDPKTKKTVTMPFGKIVPEP